jgi:hypothetical protein
MRLLDDTNPPKRLKKSQLVPNTGAKADTNSNSLDAKKER